MDIIKIGCPVCGTILRVKNVPGIEAKTAICPVCKTSSPFTAFKIVRDGGEPTEVNIGQENRTIGELRLAGTERVFPLAMGRNVIGRQADGNTATIQIPEPTRRLSRRHLVIEVKEVPHRGILHCVSLFKEQVNPTFVDDTRLEFGDSLVLASHARLRLPQVELLFVIPDEDETELSPHKP